MSAMDKVPGVLPYYFEVDDRGAMVTALGGLPVYLDLAHLAGLCRMVQQNMKTRPNQGWTDGQMVLALVMLNLAGGECVEDIRRLAADKAFMKVYRRAEHHGLGRQERRELARRFRRGRKGDLPSPSAIFDWLAEFHDPEQEKLRQEGKAFVPAANEALQGLAKVIGGLAAFVQKQHPVSIATLDMDATLIETFKEAALYGYKGYKAYQPLNVSWFEQGQTLYSEFRDGNVPAGYEQLRVFKAALALLPPGVLKVRLRSDTAGYEHALLRYCALGENATFGVIDFCISCDISPQFKEATLRVGVAEWHKEMRRNKKGEEEWTGREWAEVNFVPEAIGRSKKDPEYRYVAVRERLQQQALPGMEEGQPKLPFPTLEIEAVTYKLHGIVTNMAWEGSALLRFHYERCGKSEERHAVHKEDFAGGKMPSGDFGENAAWWLIAVLSANLNEAMKRLVLEGDWASKRMKAIRFWLINVTGQLLQGVRQLGIRLAKEHRGSRVLAQARQRIAQMATATG